MKQEEIFEQVAKALQSAAACFELRDEFNAGIHCEPTRLSPLTVKVKKAHALFTEWMADQQRNGG